ncbi:MAG: ABC transporter ATP-binding protein [Blastocatellia bacterium]
MTQAYATPPAIEFRDVSLAFDDLSLLEHISFRVPRGAMRVLIGPSRCGKSTIIRLAIGLLRPDSGQILLEGREISHTSEEELLPLRLDAGVVLQTDALFSMTVAENVGYRLARYGMDEAQIETEVRRVLRIVDLEDAWSLAPEELSGGMSRRVAIARAMAGSPRIMLYDSLCAGLDPITSRRLMAEIIRQRDLAGVSSIYVTQNLDEVRYLCSRLGEAGPDGEMRLRREDTGFCVANTRVLMLTEGRLIFDREDELLWNAADPRIREFVG